MDTGLGGAVVRHGDVVVAALIAVNAFGAVDHGGFVPDEALDWVPEGFGPPGAGENTTIGVIVTNARLDKVGCLVVAQGGRDGLGRSLLPPHTRVDGDALVVAATGNVDSAGRRCPAVGGGGGRARRALHHPGRRRRRRGTGRRRALAWSAVPIALDLLRDNALACTRCKLAGLGRTQVVFGVGDPAADLLFVGEGPGAEEDRLGEPFVGRSGKLLDQLMAEENSASPGRRATSPT